MKVEPMLLNQRNGADCFGIKQTILEHSVLLRLQHILTAFGALLLCFEGEYIVLKQ